jgi:YtkA-like protein
VPRLGALPVAAVLLVAGGAAPAMAADRARAVVACKAAGPKFAYDCTIKLTNQRTGAPLEKAKLSIGADMPSMPMAHNVRPVTATETAPGEYQVRLALEMFGDWAVRLSVAGPLRDQVVEVLNFSEQGSGPPLRKSVRPDGHLKH